MITEQEAIKRIKECRNTPSFQPYMYMNEALDMAIAALEKQIRNSWVKCEDGLPMPQEDGNKEFTDTVLISTSYNIVTDAFYCFSDKQWYKQGNAFMLGKVLAWQPLPELYKE